MVNTREIQHTLKKMSLEESSLFVVVRKEKNVSDF